MDQMQDTNEKKVKDYDFKRPAKFSKEHLRTLEMIYEHYGRLLSTTLPLYLRKNVQVSVANSETVTYSEFSNALSNPVILGVINFLPLQGTIILELQANIGFSFIDRMLGGEGTGLDKPRPFTDIEMPLIEKLVTLADGCRDQSGNGEDRDKSSVCTGYITYRHDRHCHTQYQDR